MKIKEELELLLQWGFSTKSEFNDGISQEMFDSAWKMLKLLNLDESLLYDEDNVYASSHDTVCIDLEKGQNVISIEIGHTSYSYYYEVNGKDTKQREHVSLDDVKELSQDIENLIKL